MRLNRRMFLKQSLAASIGTSAGLTMTNWALAQTDTNTVPPPEPYYPYLDAVFKDGPPPKLSEGAFTIAVLPDTQYYSAGYPKTYDAQTRWIVEQKKKRKIACVLHLGDFVDLDIPKQWENAVKSMSILDGEVPYFFVPGNHDYTFRNTATFTHLNDYFPVSKYKDLKTFGGVYDREPDKMENSYGFFSAGGRDFLVVCLEFGPRKDVIRWANEVVSKHRDREAILLTHAFTYSDNRRYDWKKFGNKQEWNPHSYNITRDHVLDDAADGEQLWQELVAQHQSFIFTINGHVCNDGLGRQVTPTPDGREIPQMLVNFQTRPNGGDGWLRLLEMCPDRTMNVIDYSVTRNQCNISPKNKFSVQLAPFLVT